MCAIKSIGSLKLKHWRLPGKNTHWAHTFLIWLLMTGTLHSLPWFSDDDISEGITGKEFFQAVCLPVAKSSTVTEHRKCGPNETSLKQKLKTRELVECRTSSSASSRTRTMLNASSAFSHRYNIMPWDIHCSVRLACKMIGILFTQTLGHNYFWPNKLPSIMQLLPLWLGPAKHKRCTDWLIELIELKFYDPLNTKQIISETFIPANLLA